MTQIDAFIIGLVQGLSEFLPISSSGHLVVFQDLLGFKEHSLLLDIVVHVGTVLSILTIYRRTILLVLKDILKSIKSKASTNGLYLFLIIILANIPTGLIGIFLKSKFESLFSNFTAVGFAFFFTAFLLFLTKKKNNEQNIDMNDFSNIKEISPKKALIIGVAQGLAITPGLSRSGSTIATAILLGIPRNAAALFSFLMSVPAILGAAVLQIKDLEASDNSYLLFLLTGLISSYLFGLFGLSVVLKFVRKGRLEIFSFYLIMMGLYALAKGLL